MPFPLTRFLQIPGLVAVLHLYPIHSPIHLVTPLESMERGPTAWIHKAAIVLIVQGNRVIFLLLKYLLMLSPF